MNKDIHVGCSPLSGRIYAGYLADKSTWASKRDVTGECCGAVVEHVGVGNTTVVLVNGKPAFEISVRAIADQAAAALLAATQDNNTQLRSKNAKAA